MRRSAGRFEFGATSGEYLDGRRREPFRPRLAGSMKRTQRIWLILVALTVTLGMAAWLITSVGGMHDRIAATSRPLAIGFVVLVTLTASASAIAAVRLLWKLGREERAAVRAPDDIV